MRLISLADVSRVLIGLLFSNSLGGVLLRGIVCDRFSLRSFVGTIIFGSIFLVASGDSMFWGGFYDWSRITVRLGEVSSLAALSGETSVGYTFSGWTVEGDFFSDEALFVGDFLSSVFFAGLDTLAGKDASLGSDERCSTIKVVFVESSTLAATSSFTFSKFVLVPASKGFSIFSSSAHFAWGYSFTRGSVSTLSRFCWSKVGVVGANLSMYSLSARVTATAVEAGGGSVF